MVISNDRKWHLANGFRPVLQSGDPKRLAGKPFRVPVSVLNATALAVDLTQRGTWANERRVAKAFAIASTADTARLDATLWLDAVRLRFVVDMSQVTGANKAKLFAAATEPYLSGQVGGMEFRALLSYDEAMKAIEALDSDLATTTTYVVLSSAPIPVPSGMRVYLYSDSLSLVSDAAVAMGADYGANLELYGTLHPGDVGSAHPGAAVCGADAGPTVSGDSADTPTITQEIAGIRTANLTIDSIYRGFPGN